MAFNAGEINIRIKGDNADFRQAVQDSRKAGGDLSNTLKKDLGASLDSTKSSFAQTAKAVALGAAAYDLTRRAVFALASGLKRFVGESVDASLELERQKALLPVLAEGYGVTMEAINANVDAIRSENKSVVEAIKVTKRMLQANIDLSDSEQILTAARNLGAQAGVSSSDAMDAILKSIVKVNPSYLEQIDLVISEREVYMELADALGVTTGQLTMAQKRQGLYNAIMAEGVKVAGAYDASMDTTGKVLGSLKDGFVDVKIVVGELLDDAFFPIVKATYNALKAFRAWAFDGMEINPLLKELGGNIGNAVLTTFNAIVGAVQAVVGVFRSMFSTLQQTGFIEAFRMAFEKIGIALRENLLPAFQRLMESLKPYEPVLLMIAKLLGGALLLALLGALEALSLAIKGFSAFIEVIAFVHESFLGFLGGMRDGAVGVFNAIRNALAEFWDAITLAFDEGLLRLNEVVMFGLSFILGAFGLNFAGIRQTITDFWTAAKDIFSRSLTSIRTTWTATWTAVSAFLSPVTEAIRIVLSSLWEGIKELFSKGGEAIGDGWSKVWEGIKSVAKSVSEAVGNTVKAMVNKIIDGLNWLIRKANEIARKGMLGLGGNVSLIPEIPHLAKGGIVTSPTLALIGEAGPEAVVPLSGANAGAAGMNITINNPIVREEQDLQRIAEAVRSALGRDLELARSGITT